MELAELEKMTVTKLREETAKFEDIKDATGMSKEQLIDVLCGKLGIRRKVTIRKGIGRRALKEKITQMRAQLGDVLAAGDRKKTRIYRRRIKGLRRRLRKIVVRATREAKRAPAKEASPPAS